MKIQKWPKRSIFRSSPDLIGGIPLPCWRGFCSEERERKGMEEKSAKENKRGLLLPKHMLPVSMQVDELIRIRDLAGGSQILNAPRCTATSGRFTSRCYQFTPWRFADHKSINPTGDLKSSKLNEEQWVPPQAVLSPGWIISVSKSNFFRQRLSRKPAHTFKIFGNFHQYMVMTIWILSAHVTKLKNIVV